MNGIRFDHQHYKWVFNQHYKCFFVVVSIVSVQNKEGEGTPTSRNTLCSTVAFTPLSQNPPQHHSSQAIPPPQNPPPAQPLEHHSLLHPSSSKSHPHTTPPLQNPPLAQPLEHHSQLCTSSPKSRPHTTPHSLQNPPPTQALQHHSPPHISSSKSLPYTTPLHQNPPTTQHLQHHSPSRVSSSTSPPQTTLLLKILQRFRRTRMPMWMNIALLFCPHWGNFKVMLRIINTNNRGRTWMF
jgi:hypothetical protein